MTEIHDYHAHVYFDAATRDQARRLCESARDRFGLQMGRMHDRNVGPHPSPSCQLLVPPQHFDTVIPWLLLNRDGLTVFVHANTGDALVDHTDHTIWLGPSQPLDLSAL